MTLRPKPRQPQSTNLTRSHGQIIIHEENLQHQHFYKPQTSENNSVVPKRRAWTLISDDEINCGSTEDDNK